MWYLDHFMESIYSVLGIEICFGGHFITWFLDSCFEIVHEILKDDMLTVSWIRFLKIYFLIGIEKLKYGQLINSWIFEEFKFGIEIWKLDKLVMLWNIWFCNWNWNCYKWIVIELFLKKYINLKRGSPLLIFYIFDRGSFKI